MLNIDVLEEVLFYIEKKINPVVPFLRLYIATNGTLLTKDTIKLISKYNCIPWISLDPSNKAHNRNRVYKDGRGTFEDVVNGIKRLKYFAEVERKRRTTGIIKGWQVCILN